MKQFLKPTAIKIILFIISIMGFGYVRKGLFAYIINFGDYGTVSQNPDVIVTPVLRDVLIFNFRLPVFIFDLVIAYLLSSLLVFLYKKLRTKTL